MIKDEIKLKEYLNDACLSIHLLFVKEASEAWDRLGLPVSTFKGFTTQYVTSRWYMFTVVN